MMRLMPAVRHCAIMRMPTVPLAPTSIVFQCTIVKANLAAGAAAAARSGVSFKLAGRPFIVPAVSIDEGLHGRYKPLAPLDQITGPLLQARGRVFVWVAAVSFEGLENGQHQFGKKSHPRCRAPQCDQPVAPRPRQNSRPFCRR